MLPGHKSLGCLFKEGYILLYGKLLVLTGLFLIYRLCCLNASLGIGEVRDAGSLDKNKNWVSCFDGQATVRI